MISSIQAQERIRGLSDEQLRDLTCARLLGKDITPLTGGYFDEPPQFLVIRLLESTPTVLADSQRSAVIAGCRQVYGQVLAWLATTETVPPDNDMAQAGVRVSDVVDAARPPELSGLAAAFLELTLKAPSVPDEVLRAGVRAGLSYVKRGDDTLVRHWRRILAIESVAAYGFNALLEIDPYSSRIERALHDLWINQLKHAWRVDTPALMRRAARARGSFEWMNAFFRELQTSPDTLPDGQALWTGIQDVLGARSWSSDWLARAAHAPLAEPCIDLARQNDSAEPATALSFCYAPGLSWSYALPPGSSFSASSMDDIAQPTSPYGPVRVVVDEFPQGSLYCQQLRFYTEPRGFAARWLFNQLTAQLETNLAVKDSAHYGRAEGRKYA